jgi:hypothetical protein
MAWAAGSYTKGNNGTGGWVGDASLGIGIEAGRHDTQDNDFATGINQCINKDGSNAFTADPNLGGFKPTNIAAGTAAAPALCVGGDVNTGVFGPAADTWAVATNGTERVRVLSDGKVGIGTTAPADALEVATTSFFPQYWSSYPGASAGGTNLILRRSRGATVGTNTILQNNDVVGSFGFQGANGTTFTQCATISAVIDGTPGASNDMPGRLEFYTSADGSGSPTERMRITSGGFVFINTTTNFSADKLCLAFGTTENGLGIRDNNDTSGTTFAVFRNSANGICGSVTRVTTTNAVNYNTSSDYRLKKDIQPVENALAKLNQINPVNFVWKDCDIAATGFIAHEIAAVSPDIVSGEKDAVDVNGNPIYQGVDYGKLTPLLTAALKELNAKVEALQARVDELEGA